MPLSSCTNGTTDNSPSLFAGSLPVAGGENWDPKLLNVPGLQRPSELDRSQNPQSISRALADSSHACRDRKPAAGILLVERRHYLQSVLAAGQCYHLLKLSQRWS